MPESGNNTFIITEGTTNSTVDSQQQQVIPAKVFRRIIFKRKDVSVGSVTDYGHWWVEIYRSEESYMETNLQGSFGWWPNTGKTGDTAGTMGPMDTTVGVEGWLNAGKQYDFHADKNRKIDWDVEEMFHPLETHGRTEQAVIDEITAFAYAYSKKNKIWAWPGMEGTPRSNCRVFQVEMLVECGLLRAWEPVDPLKYKE